MRKLQLASAATLIGAAAFAGVSGSGSGNVTDSAGVAIGTFATAGNGKFFDIADDPGQDHPPNTGASASWSVPDPNDGKYSTITGGQPDGYTVEFMLYVYPYPETGPRAHSWIKRDRFGNVVDSGYLTS